MQRGANTPCLLTTSRRRTGNLRPGEEPRYIEQFSPVIFPESGDLPETQLHLELRTALYQLLFDCLGSEVTVGSGQFMYFDAAEPKQCLAPDVYVRLAPRGAPIRSWKVWERGSPEIAVEIVSDDDRPGDPWDVKLRRYKQMGVTELVRFDPEAPADSALRIWDRVEGALVEREPPRSQAPSLVLDFDWVLAPADGFERALRIAAGDGTRVLLMTRGEARKAEAEARRAAEARVVELEAELARRSTTR